MEGTGASPPPGILTRQSILPTPWQFSPSNSPPPPAAHNPYQAAPPLQAQILTRQPTFSVTRGQCDISPLHMSEVNFCMGRRAPNRQTKKQIRAKLRHKTMMESVCHIPYGSAGSSFSCSASGPVLCHCTEQASEDGSNPSLLPTTWETLMELPARTSA